MSDKQIRFLGATHPLRTETVDLLMPEGDTLLEMLRKAQPDPILLRDAVVFIDDHEISPEYWMRVRPKPGHTVTARILPVPMGGGGGGGGKSPLRTVLTIAVIAASFYLGPALGAALGFTETAVILGQTINLAAAVGGVLISVAGNLLINTIAPVRPPQMASLSGVGQSTESPSLFLSGSSNRLRPFEAVPSVLGYYRIRPPKGAKTFTEVLGDHNVLRDLFVIGYGKLELSDWQIGNTPITSYGDYELEVREGEVSDLPLTVYSNQVNQDEFSIKLEQTAGYQSRTTDLDADEISVDVAFPRGLVTFSGGGARGNRTISIDLEWRPVGGSWGPIPATFDATFDSSWVSGSTITFTHARSVAIRHGIRWKTTTRGQYEVRIHRTTLDTSSTQIFDEVFWTTLRTFTNDDPVNFPHPLAKAGLQIRSTNQLNGVVDQLSVLAKSVVLDWDTGSSTWITRASNNPASLFRHVLQGNAKAVAVPDTDIDITRLEEWHDYCVTNGFTYNRVHDFTQSVQETLADIAAAGRAGLTVEDGKWSVVIDEVQSITTTHITPRNSFGFEAEKSFLDIPHGWRIRFPNENENYNSDEMLVFRDGYDVNTATLYEAIEFAGVTDPDIIWKHGRFHGAAIVQRPERWGVNQDFEALIAKRGRRVKITHDVLLIGIASGRIKSLVVDGGGDVTSITVDEELTMALGKSYGLSIRRDVAGDVSLSVPLTAVVGTSTTVTPNPAIPAANAPEVGDIFGYGEVGLETEDALVLSVGSQSDLAGRITLIPYRASVYTADTGIIPAHVPVITEDVFLPAIEIQEVITDESVLDRGPGDVSLVRAELRVLPIDEPNVFIEVQQHSTSSTEEPFYDSDYTVRSANAVRISDVQQGESYHFRARWNEENRLPGPWTETPNVLIIGRSGVPGGLGGLTISTFGGQAHMRWDEPEELDVRFGGQVRFRHSASFASPTWAESTSIGEVAQARSLFAALPLKPGTYLARVFDADENPSDTIVSVSTKQASVLEYANVTTVDEASTFSGTHTNTVGIDNELKLDGAGLLDSEADFDAIANFDSLGGVVLSGTYDHAAGIDLVTVKRVRITSRVTASSVNVNDLIDDRTDLMDTWEDFDGTLQAQSDLQVWVRLTDDDPAGSPTWGEYQRLDSMEVEARGLGFQSRLFTNDAAFNIVVTELGVDVEEVV